LLDGCFLGIIRLKLLFWAGLKERYLFGLK
jgi:hypothetical protein